MFMVALKKFDNLFTIFVSRADSGHDDVSEHAVDDQVNLVLTCLELDITEDRNSLSRLHRNPALATGPCARAAQFRAVKTIGANEGRDNIILGAVGVSHVCYSVNVVSLSKDVKKRLHSFQGKHSQVQATLWTRCF